MKTTICANSTIGVYLKPMVGIHIQKRTLTMYQIKQYDIVKIKNSEQVVKVMKIVGSKAVVKISKTAKKIVPMSVLDPNSVFPIDSLFEDLGDA